MSLLLSLLTTSCLLASVLHHNQQSPQTLEQRVDFNVPQILDPGRLDISINLTSPISSDMNNRTQTSVVDASEDSIGSNNVNSPQTFATGPLRDAEQQKKVMDHNNFEWKVSAQNDASQMASAAHYSYPESRKIRIAFDTQPPQSPVYAYDIGDAYDVGRGASTTPPDSPPSILPVPPPPPSPESLPPSSRTGPSNSKGASDQQQRSDDASKVQYRSTSVLCAVVGSEPEAGLGPDVEVTTIILYEYDLNYSYLVRKQLARLISDHRRSLAV